MKERQFIDTNVLVYADDLDAGGKNVVARDLIAQALAEANAVLSTQVLQEYFVVATGKLGVDPAIARRKVELFARMDVVRIDVGLILGAIDLLRLHSLSFWDALILKSASLAGCTLLVTEDLQHGQLVEGVRVENPFRPT